MNIEIKKSKKPIKYSNALEFMEERLIDINKKSKNELIWTLEHEEIYTAGTSYSESEVLDKSISKLDLPNNCLIAGVTRRENTYIPSGNWKFAAKDKLVVFTHPESIEDVEEVFC